MPRLILIYASMGRAPGRPFVRSWQQEPLAMGVLAALTPAHWQVTFYDDRVEEIDYAVEADLVAISIETYSARRGYRIAAEFGKRGIPVVMGGYHATLVPEEVAEHCDAVCVGEAETLWTAILEDALRGSLKRRYTAAGSPPFAGTRVDRSIFRGKGYMPISLIETGRGCPFACDFCSIAAFFRSTYRRRSLADIVREVAEVESDWLLFVDDNLTGDTAGARELFAAIKPYRKRWITQTSVAGLHDREFVREMADSGCMGVLIGFESLNRENLGHMRKPLNRREEFGAILANLREAGIFVYGTFMFGYPQDDAGLFAETVRFAIDEKMFIAAFNHLVPFPGTPLHARLEKEGKMRYGKWWLSGEFHFGEVPFNPARMTAAEIEESCLQARKQFYSFPSIVRRAMDGRCNCASPLRALFYARLNHLLRREINEKRGVMLGFGDA